MKSQSDDSKTVTDIQDAINVFVGGFCFTRSRTHPYESSRVDGLWRMSDAQRKQAKDYRREEWIAYRQNPERVNRIARQHVTGRFVVCAIREMDSPLEPLRDAYKSLDYRFGGREGFFAHELAKIPASTCHAAIERVRTMAVAEELGVMANSKPMPKEWIDDPSRFRQYVARVDGKIIGYVSSVTVGKRNWVSNLLVTPTHRRKGIGKALMAKLLRDDRAAGSQGSVLLASSAGAMLYPEIGYRQIGELLIFTPKK